MSLGSTPADRLASSRERLRLAMRGSPPPAHRADGHGPIGGADWLQSLKSSPGGAVLIETVGRWWDQHPLRLVGMVAADAANATLKPMAQRHPLGLLVAALLVGGALAWSRPWRWLLTPALFAGLLPQLLSKAMTLIPAGSWMAVLTSLAREPAQDLQRSAHSDSPSSPRNRHETRGETSVDGPATAAPTQPHSPTH